jgi:hypothetical protein
MRTLLLYTHKCVCFTRVCQRMFEQRIPPSATELLENLLKAGAYVVSCCFIRHPYSQADPNQRPTALQAVKAR